MPISKTRRDVPLSLRGHIDRDLADKLQLLNSRVTNLDPKTFDGFLVCAIGEAQTLLMEIRDLSILKAYLKGAKSVVLAQTLSLSEGRVSQILLRLKSHYGIDKK